MDTEQEISELINSLTSIPKWDWEKVKKIADLIAILGEFYEDKDNWSGVRRLVVIIGELAKPPFDIRDVHLTIEAILIIIELSRDKENVDRVKRLIGILRDLFAVDYIIS